MRVDGARWKLFIKNLVVPGYVVVLMMVITGFGGIAAGSENLIHNGHFLEVAASGAPNEWRMVHSGSSHYAARVDKEAFNGSPALRLDGDVQEGRVIVVQTDLPAEEVRGHTYRFSAWYKGHEIQMRSGVQHFLRFEFFDRKGPTPVHAGPPVFIYPPDGSTDWILLEHDVTIPQDTDVIWVSISLQNADGTAWWTDVKLEPLQDVADESVSERQPGTFYVSPDGDDGAPGTLESPWKTPDFAGRQAIPGDVILFLPGEYEGTLRPVRSGKAEGPITFKALERRTARLVGGYSPAYALHISGVEHIQIEGFHIRPMSDQGRWMLMEHAKHVRIDDVLMEKAMGSMPFLITHSEQIQMRDSVIREYVGGNMARISHSKHLLFEGNAISRTGHSPFQFYPIGSAQYVVVRNNVFHAAWGRALEFFSTRDLLFEGNIVTNSYDGGRSNSAGSNFSAHRGIVRYNRIFRNWGGPISAWGGANTGNPDEDMYYSALRWYHNVFDDNLDFALTQGLGADNIFDLKYVNNIFSRNDRLGTHRQVQFSGEGRPEVGPDGQLVPRFHFLRNVVVAEELKSEETMSYGAQSVSVNMVESDVWRNLFRSTGASHFADNLVVLPAYVDESNYNHQLAVDSQLIDRGHFLTQAVGTDEGNVLPVDDAAYFYDGFGIEGEVGDLIAVGSADNIARVVKVDRENNELTLDRSVRWHDGDPVNFPWGGDGPDIGAYEYDATGRPSVVVAAKPFMLLPHEPVHLSVELLGIDDPVEIRWQLGDGTVAFGSELTHRYAEPYDYPIRVRVTTASGDIVRGTGYVVVEAPQAIGDPLIHSTFDADDEDWWWLWKSYRPMPTDWARELDPATGHGILRISNPGGGNLPLKLAPVGWDIDQYPWIYLRYRVSPGTPIGFFLDGFRGTNGERRMWIAATPDGRAARTGRMTPYELIDDGNWHTLVMDARVIREHFPEVNVLRRLGAETVSGSKTGDTYALDEAAILPSEAFDTPEWQGKIASMQRGHVDVVAPTDEARVHGEITIAPVLVLYASPSDGSEQSRVSQIDIAIDGESIVTTENFQDVSDVRVDTTELSDGLHHLTVSYTDDVGTNVTREVSFTVRNWDVMKDRFTPPETWLFFGETMVTDHSMTMDESDGWAYTVNLEDPQFENVTGKVKTTDDEAFLVWEAPGLRSFEIVVHVKATVLGSVLRAVVDVGNGEWVDRPYEVVEETTEGSSSEYGWTKYVLKGAGPDGAEAEAFKLHIGSGAAAYQLRVEEVSLNVRAL